MLGKPDIVTQVHTPRLTLNADDNEIFRQITLVKRAERALNVVLESHKKLEQAFNFFAGRFQELIEGLGADAWQQPLLDWYQFTFANAKVIEVSVAEEARAFVIFETLNDRGLDLSTADLLKNHLLGQSGDRIEEVKALWNRAMASFQKLDDSADSDAFLRHFWASKKGVVRVKALYSQMKPEVKDPEEAMAFSAELAECAPLWTTMFDRDSEVWQGYSQGSIAALDTLRNFKVEQCRPLLLSALRRLAPNEVEQLLGLVIAWSVRWFVVGGGGGGTVERLYAEAAKKITEGELTTADQIAGEFAPSVANDQLFGERFGTAVVPRGWLARYYLHVLERQKNGDPEPERVPNQDVDQVNLEHVLPKNADAGEWPAFSNEELQNMKLMLGNQALLRKSHNDQIGNSSFAIKRPILAASDLELTKEVEVQGDWTPAAIRDRQAALAKLAVEAWQAK